MNLPRVGRRCEAQSERVGIMLNNLFPSTRCKVQQTNTQGSPIQAREFRHGALEAGDLGAKYENSQRNPENITAGSYRLGEVP